MENNNKIKKYDYLAVDPNYKIIAFDSDPKILRCKSIAKGCFKPWIIRHDILQKQRYVIEGDYVRL